MIQLFRIAEQTAMILPIYKINRRAYLGPRTKLMEDPVMLNLVQLQNRLLPSLLAALAVSILVVMASLTHAVAAIVPHV
jgi:hypothetical protein